MPFTFGSTPNRVNAHELFFGSFEDFKDVFYEVLYGDRDWRNVVPEASIDTDINPGATSTSYGVRDRKGKGGFRGRLDQGVPSVDITRDKNSVPIAVAGVTANFDREDARQVEFGYNGRLLGDLSTAMKESCEDHVEGVIMFGDANVGFLPFLDYTSVPSGSAVAGVSTSSLWANKTADEIVFDVNDAIASVWIDSKMVHLPDTVRLPGAQFARIATLKMSTQADKSVLDYLKLNNVYTATTGQPLDIKPLRYLDKAGAGSTARMMVEHTDKDNQLLPFPIPFDLLEPQPQGYGVDLYAEYKFGSYHLRRPASRRYVDGI